MTLPLVLTVGDCADYSKVVAPYIPQLQELPFKVWSSISDPSALYELYLQTNPLVTSVAFALALSPIVLILSEINGNYSQIDRLWSLLPTIYNAHYTWYAHAVGLPTEKIDTICTFSVLWSARLTFNYWRKGGYEIGSEDYRWEVLKKKANNRFLFFLFNVTFISTTQSLLLWSITTPTYLIMLTTSLRDYVDTFTVADLAFSRVLVGLVATCFFADQQQWDFQKAKKYYFENNKTVPKGCGQDAEDLERGFVVSGLWSWSRHPNFAAEQAIWVCLYQWGCYSSETLWNWTAIGAVSYLALFQGSTVFTEALSAGKYPQYKEYQQRVGKFFPKFGTQDMNDAQEVTQKKSK